MTKTQALQLLGGTVSSAAKALEITRSAVSQWPEELPRSAENAVLAVLARRHLPADLLAADGATTALNQEVRDAA